MAADAADLSLLKRTLVNSVDNSPEKLARGWHKGGIKCRCSECVCLKKQEDKWICKLGTFYGTNGFSTRDEGRAISGVNFVGN